MCPTFRSNTRIWVALNEQAFRRIDRLTRVVVLDNLGEGVLAPDVYDGTFAEATLPPPFRETRLCAREALLNLQSKSPGAGDRP